MSSWSALITGSARSATRRVPDSPTPTATTPAGPGGRLGRVPQVTGEPGPAAVTPVSRGPCPYGVDATFMQAEVHGWDIHAVSAPGRRAPPVTRGRVARWRITAAAPQGLPGRAAGRPDDTNAASTGRAPRQPLAKVYGTGRRCAAWLSFAPRTSRARTAVARLRQENSARRWYSANHLARHVDPAPAPAGNNITSADGAARAIPPGQARRPAVRRSRGPRSEFHEEKSRILAKTRSCSCCAARASTTGQAF